MEFESTYASALEGAISRDEFEESIDRINRKILSKPFLIIVPILFAFAIVGTIVLFIVGLTTSSSFGPSPLIGIAVGLFFLAVVCTFTGCVFHHCRYVGRMRRAIAAESAKYSSREPISCRWKLESSSDWSDEQHGEQISHHVSQLIAG